MDSEAKDLYQHLITLGEKATDDASEAEESRQKLLVAARKLSIALETEGDIADRILYQPAGNVAIRIAVDLGIFEILTQSTSPKSTKELAERTGADYVLLARIMRILAAIYAVEEVETESYVASKTSRAFSNPKGTSGARFFINMLYPIWEQLPALLAETKYQNPSNGLKTAAQKAFSTDKHIFQIMGERPNILGDFLTFMSAQREGRPGWLDFFPVESQLIQGFCDDRDAVIFVDIGGAGGHECQALRQKYPHLPGRVVLQDLPDVIEKFKAHKTTGVEAMAHDFFEPQPVKGARAYYMRNVLHDWNDDQCRAILQQLAASMSQGYSKTLINEMVVPLKGASLFTTHSDLNMMSVTAGMERTEKQWRELLGAVGLKIARIWTGREDSESIIEAVLE